MLFNIKLRLLNLWNNPVIVITGSGHVRFLNARFYGSSHDIIRQKPKGKLRRCRIDDVLDLRESDRIRIYRYLEQGPSGKEGAVYINTMEHGFYLKITRFHRSLHLIELISKEEIDVMHRLTYIQIEEGVPSGNDLLLRTASLFLKERERMLEVFNSLEDLVHVTNNNYTIEYMNPAMIKLFGDGTGDCCYRVINGFDAPCRGCKLKLISEGKSVHYEVFIEKNRSYYDVINTPYVQPDGSLFKVSLMRNITELKEHQEKLKIFQNAIENSTNGIAICTLGGDSTYANRVLCDYLGKTKEELDGSNIPALFGAAMPESGREYVPAEREITRNGETREFLTSLYPVADEGGEPNAMVFIAQDISGIKSMERRFEEERDHFKRMLDGSLDCFFLLDSRYRLVDSNRSFREAFQAGEGQPPDMFFPDMIHDRAQGQALKKKMEQVAKKKSSTTVELEITVEQNRCYYLMSLNPLLDDQSEFKGIYGFVKEITEIKTLQYIIENEKNYNRSIIETVNLGFVLVSDTNEYLDYNKAYLDIIGREASELDGKTFYNFTAPQFIEHQKKIMDELIKTSKSVVFEKEFIRKDGARVPVLITMSRLVDKKQKIVGTFAFIRDISEQKKIESELIKKNFEIQNLINIYNSASARFLNCSTTGEIFEAVSDSLARIIDPSSIDILTRINTDFRRIYHRNSVIKDHIISINEKNSLIVKRVMDRKTTVIVKDISTELNEEDLNIFRGLHDKPSAIFIPLMVRGEVSGIMVLSMKKKIFDPDDVLVNILMGTANLASITMEKIYSMEERAEMRSALERSEKLTSMGRIIAGVAHEINNPLSIMQFDLDELKSQVSNREGAWQETDELIKSLQEEIRRISGIVNQLRDYSKPSDVPEEFVAVDDVLRNYPIRILLKNMNKKGVKINLRLSAEKALIRIPRNRLIQVLMNLLTNADDAIREKERGEISIESRRLQENVSYVLVIIRDNGIGISQDDLGRIFEPFFTTKKSEGTGLGLSISYSIIKSYNGEIEVRSKPGEGAEFIIYFPESFK